MVLQEEEGGAGMRGVCVGWRDAGRVRAEQDTQNCWALSQMPDPDLDNQNFRRPCPGTSALSELPRSILVVVLVWTLLSRGQCPCMSPWT